MDYIESEMAKRSRPVSTDPDPEMAGVKETGGPNPSDLPRREPATLGKLHEIDLGQEAKLQNIARTEAATRRPEDEVGTSDPDAAKAGGCPSKEGKRRRYRKRRTSDDVQRDRLVEEVLRESKCKLASARLETMLTYTVDVYDEPEEEPSDEQAADDRIAEQFRRDFLDAMQSRRRVTKPNPKTAKAEPPKGPKLGGSRSARAAMREQEKK